MVRTVAKTDSLLATTTLEPLVVGVVVTVFKVVPALQLSAMQQNRFNDTV